MADKKTMLPKTELGSGDLFRLLLEFTDYAVIFIDPNGKIMSWNLGAEATYGYSTEEALQSDITIFYQDNINENSFNSNFEKALMDGRVHYECWQHRKDGSLFLAELIKTPLHTQDGIHRGFAMVVKDITFQRASEKEAMQFQQMLEQQVSQRTKELEAAIKELEAFSYSVSHDLRAPLRSIHGFSKILEEDYADKFDAEGKRYLNNIINSAIHMGNLIDDLLKFSRMSQLELIDSAVDMNKMVHQVIESLKPLDDKVDYRFSISQLHTCVGDENMLRQVWTNLIDNAMKYSRHSSPSEIEIGSTRLENAVQYFIRDNGVGFNMKYADKLFEVFQRLHSKGEFEGTGLGLALVRRIVHKHGGDVWAEAEVGKGAAFYFKITDRNK